MGLQIKKFYSADRAIKYLGALAKSKMNVIFRGQRNHRWLLQTSLSRFLGRTNDVLIEDEMHSILSTFKANLARLGKYQLGREDEAYWLEMAQHYGVPTPYLDFTYSPYIALFFAFNGVISNWSYLHGINSRAEYSIVYALDVESLAYHLVNEQFGNGTGNDDSDRYEWFLSFTEPNLAEFFGNGLPPNKLQFIPYPSWKNGRMQRQMGAFIYDALDYSKLGVSGLEEYLSNLNDPEIFGATLTKVYISHNCADEVFDQLALMGITGTLLFMDESGAAMDVKNLGFHQTMKVWDA